MSILIGLTLCFSYFETTAKLQHYKTITILSDFSSYKLKISLYSCINFLDLMPQQGHFYSFYPPPAIQSPLLAFCISCNI
jgi:hypothetical protein